MARMDTTRCRDPENRLRVQKQFRADDAAFDNAHCNIQSCLQLRITARRKNASSFTQPQQPWTSDQKHPDIERFMIHSFRIESTYRFTRFLGGGRPSRYDMSAHPSVINSRTSSRPFGLSPCHSLQAICRL
jgi:hypothetical protein